jgi:hypothetical protein
MLTVVPPPLDRSPFRDALEVARTAHFTPEEWDAYDLAKMAEQDARGALSLAQRQGEIQGEIRGEATMLLELLDHRFGPPDDVLVARIRAAKPPQLRLWAKRVLSAQRIEEVFDP